EPFDKRRSPELQGEAIMARLREEYAKEIREGMIGVFGAPPVMGLGTAGGFKLMVEDRGDLGSAFLQQEAFKLIGASRQAPAAQSTIAGLFTQFRANTPQVYADIDRAKVRSLGLTMKQVNDTLQAFIGSLYVNNFNEFGRFWQVNVMADLPFRSSEENLNLIKMRNNKGQ